MDDAIAELAIKYEDNHVIIKTSYDQPSQKSESDAGIDVIVKLCNGKSNTAAFFAYNEIMSTAKMPIVRMQPMTSAIFGEKTWSSFMISDPVQITSGCLAGQRVIITQSKESLKLMLHLPNLHCLPV